MLNGNRFYFNNISQNRVNFKDHISTLNDFNTIQFQTVQQTVPQYCFNLIYRYSFDKVTIRNSREQLFQI